MSKFIEMSGKVIGLWNVISYEGDSKWKCICRCGAIGFIPGDMLRGGKTTKCRSCYLKESKERMENNRKDITGYKYGNWTVVKHIYGGKYLCKCKCGCELEIVKWVLTQGKSKSCSRCMAGRKINPPYMWAKNMLKKEYREGAIKRGYKWDISDEDFFNLLQGNCLYCGKTPTEIPFCVKITGKTENKTYYYFNGIDRIDNKEGYIIGNVVTCCSTCNRAKHVMTNNDFKIWINRLKNHIT